jgi:hypothetical protein
MYEVSLPGISGSNPIGAMAAFGLFRIVFEERPFGLAKLSWQFVSDWHPVLHCEEPLNIDTLTEFLINRQPSRTSAEFISWNDDIKSNPEVFRTELLKVETDERCRFFCAFGSESITAKSTSDVKPTAFHMTAGQQRFLKLCAVLSNSLDPTEKRTSRQTNEQRLEELNAAWRETLNGPWTYSDDTHSLGWDPTTEGLYALSDRSPSASGARSVRGAVWLAFESLPLFPSVPVRKKLQTTGFDVDAKHFTWPVWRPSISLHTLHTWLAAPELVEPKPDMPRLKRRGFSALFRAQCLRDGNGRGTFRNAREIT